MWRPFVKILLTSLLFFSQSYSLDKVDIEKNNQKETIIFFDLGQTLLGISKLKIIYTLGTVKIITDLLPYGLANGKLPDTAFYDKVFAFGDRLKLCQDPEKKCIKEFYKGLLSPHVLMNSIKENVDKKEHSEFFVNEQEKNVIKDCSDFVLNPLMIQSIMYLDYEGLNLVKECIKKGYKIYLLSDFDPESIKLIMIRFPELFSLFNKENLILSGDIKRSKSDVNFFGWLKEELHLNLDKQTCLVIDDQQKIIDACNQFGFIGIRYKKNWNAVRNELVELDLLEANDIRQGCYTILMNQFSKCFKKAKD
jgi:FMN phosphatase YigB (HAD superfamily)